MDETGTQILVVGGGLGGIAGALASLRMGMRVILTDETDWIGGQCTLQAVPPDENPWIDSHETGGTESYRSFRRLIRDHYRHYYPLTDRARREPGLNPGEGNVSPLCHEPRVALAVLRSMLLPFEANGRLRILYNLKPIRVQTQGDSVEAVTFRDTVENKEVTIEASFVLDATDLGDLLPLSGTEHTYGAESRDETGEPHAVDGEHDYGDQQAFSWCFAVDYIDGSDCTIERPLEYHFWRTYKASFWPGPQLDWTTPDPVTLKPIYRPLFSGPTEERRGTDWWHFRRIVYRPYFQEGFFPSDISIVNWPQIDYWIKPLLGVSEGDRGKALADSRQLSLSFLYWMQTEAATASGGRGYRGLRCRGDLLGKDLLSKRPYTREGYRMLTVYTIREQDVGVEARGKTVGAERYRDSVGIGSYRIDLHPSTAGRTYLDIDTWPFQIPLGSLIPIRVENLLPAGKNLGVTHITNGCYRLHPVEWNIGEAAGALSAFCVDRGKMPRQVLENENLLDEFQRILTEKLGFILEWPEEIRTVTREKKDPLGV